MNYCSFHHHLCAKTIFSSEKWCSLLSFWKSLSPISHNNLGQFSQFSQNLTLISHLPNACTRYLHLYWWTVGICMAGYWLALVCELLLIGYKHVKLNPILIVRKCEYNCDAFFNIEIYLKSFINIKTVKYVIWLFYLVLYDSCKSGYVLMDCRVYRGLLAWTSQAVVKVDWSVALCMNYCPWGA